MVKLLFDENLSRRLVARLHADYPHSRHVFDLDLGGGHDLAVWEAARVGEFLIVTKDADSHRLTLIRGFPPKVVWIRFGNSSTAQVEVLLRTHRDNLVDFADDLEGARLAIG